MELLVVLQLLLVVADGLSVVAAEVSVAVLHPAADLTRELEKKQVIGSSSICLHTNDTDSFPGLPAAPGSVSHLCDQDVRHSFDGVVPVTGRHQALSLALFEAGQEVCVQLQQVFQAGEQAVQSARVHLQVLLQLPDVDAQHDLQRPHMMHLSLHQLCTARISLCQTHE